MTNNAHYELIQKISYIRHTINQSVRSLLHENYTIVDMIDVRTEYDPKMFKLSLIVHRNDIEDIITKLNVAKEAMQNAIEICEKDL